MPATHHRHHAHPLARLAIAVIGVTALTLGACSDSSSKSAKGAAPPARNSGQAGGVPSAPPKAAAVPADVEPVVTTFAGSGLRGFGDGAGRDAVFNRPFGLVQDKAGNLYVSDRGNDVIRKIAPDGVVSVFAGSGVKGFTDGADRTAQFNSPAGLAIDGAGTIYVADSGNDMIRKIASDGVVSIYAGLGERGFTDGQGRTAKFHTPTALVIDAAGNLYVADSGNDLIRKIEPGGIVSTVAGSERGFADGQGKAAKFNEPSGLAFDTNGNLYVADAGNDLIRKLTLSGAVTTLAGSERGFADGQGQAAKFNEPRGLLVDGAGTLYVADSGNDIVRKVTAEGVVATFAGAGERGFNDAAGRAAQFNTPTALLVEPSGALVVADEGNNQIRRLLFESRVTLLAGSGATGYTDAARREAVFNRVSGLVFDGSGNLYVADAGNDLIRKITPDGTTTTFAGTGAKGFADGTLRTARFNSPTGLALDIFNSFYVADSGNDIVRIIRPDGYVFTIAGTGIRGYQDGPGSQARFNQPAAVTVDLQGMIYVADTGNDVIRKITPEGIVSTLAGTGIRGYAEGDARTAQFNAPAGIAVDGAGNVYVADTGNDVLRRISPDGQVITWAGSIRGFTDGKGKEARFNAPSRISFDFAGNIYVADSGNDLIRRIAKDATVTTFAGTGERGFAEGKPRESQFNTPAGVIADITGNVYVADQGNGLIRKITVGQTR